MKYSVIPNNMGGRKPLLNIVGKLKTLTRKAILILFSKMKSLERCWSVSALVKESGFF